MRFIQVLLCGASLALPLTGCRNLSAYSGPPIPLPPTVTVDRHSAPSGEFVQITVEAGHLLPDNSHQADFAVGPTIIGLCLLPSTELVEDGRCDSATVFTQPEGVTVRANEALSVSTNVTVGRGTSAIVRHTVGITLDSPGGVTIVGVVTHPAEGGQKYQYLSHSSVERRAFVRFQ